MLRQQLPEGGLERPNRNMEHWTVGLRKLVLGQCTVPMHCLRLEGPVAPGPPACVLSGALFAQDAVCSTVRIWKNCGLWKYWKYGTCFW